MSGGTRTQVSCPQIPVRKVEPSVTKLSYLTKYIVLILINCYCMERVCSEIYFLLYVK